MPRRSQACRALVPSRLRVSACQRRAEEKASVVQRPRARTAPAVAPSVASPCSTRGASSPAGGVGAPAGGGRVERGSGSDMRGTWVAGRGSDPIHPNRSARMRHAKARRHHATQTRPSACQARANTGSAARRAGRRTPARSPAPPGRPHQAVRLRLADGNRIAQQGQPDAAAHQVEHGGFLVDQRHPLRLDAGERAGPEHPGQQAVVRRGRRGVQPRQGRQCRPAAAEHLRAPAGRRHHAVGKAGEHAHLQVVCYRKRARGPYWPRGRAIGCPNLQLRKAPAPGRPGRSRRPGCRRPPGPARRRSCPGAARSPPAARLRRTP